jgi:hypothetical protein
MKDEEILKIRIKIRQADMEKEKLEVEHSNLRRLVGK